MTNSNDTIVAIASPIGTGAVSTIRISGPESWKITNNVLNRKINNPIPRRVYKRLIIDDKGPVDDVLIVFYKSPKSYTGEDMVEVFCHGGYIVTNMVLKVFLNSGARQAEPGEFTKRAFLNGKIDLSEAEAIKQLIEARAENEARAFIKNILGSIRNYVEHVRKELLSVIAEIEVEIDYPDDFVLDRNKVERKLEEIKRKLEEILQKSELSVRASQGIRLAIVGRPNVGKSTLFNKLLNEDRAIVTSIPGTTRDVISEDINIMGQYYKLLDTAGIRHSKDQIEKIGVERTKKEINTADIVLFVIDPLQYNDEDIELYNILKEKPHIIIINKIDILENEKNYYSRFLKEFKGEKIVMISAKTGEGLKNLENAINDVAQIYIKTLHNNIVLTTHRQKELLESTYFHIKEALQSLHNGLPTDLIAIDIRKSIEKLDLITGRNFTEDLLDTIFSNFCVGK